MLTPAVIAVYAGTAFLTPFIANSVAKATGFKKCLKKQKVVQDIPEEEIEPIDWDEDESVDPSI